MGILPNIFSDPALRARQDQLNSQWSALNDLVNNCQLTAGNSTLFNEFSADYYDWQQFYNSESDWTTSSRNATDSWQTKLQDYTKQVGDQCNQGADGSSPFIPTVKDPPPPPADSGGGILDQLKSDIAAPFQWAEGLALKIGIGVGVFLLILIGFVVFLVYHKSVNVGRSGVSVT